MEVDKFLAMSKTVGFSCVLKAHTAILIPGTYAYIVVSNETARTTIGIKWSVCGDQKRAFEAVTVLSQYCEESATSEIVDKVISYLKATK